MCLMALISYRRSAKRKKKWSTCSFKNAPISLAEARHERSVNKGMTFKKGQRPSPCVGDSGASPSQVVKWLLCPLLKCNKKIIIKYCNKIKYSGNVPEGGGLRFLDGEADQRILDQDVKSWRIQEQVRSIRLPGDTSKRANVANVD